MKNLPEIKQHIPDIDVPELSDPCMSLAAWRTEINNLIDKHGPQALLFFDAGHNNVQGFIRDPSIVLRKIKL